MNQLSICRRIGSDEEQQLLRTAKDDLNITSSSYTGTYFFSNLTSATTSGLWGRNIVECMLS